MADQDIKVWAMETVQDPVKGNLQRRKIQEEEWLQGWGRLNGVTNQQLNQLLFLLTSYAAPSDICPYPYPSTAAIKDTMLHMNGQTITASEAPNIFAAYGANLPDMTPDNLSGFIWVVRKH